MRLDSGDRRAEQPSAASEVDRGNAPPRRLHCVLALLLLVPPIAFLLFQLTLSPTISFVADDGNAAWIMFPTEVDPRPVVIKPNSPPDRFSRQFAVAKPARDVFVNVRALGELDLFINDRPISHEALFHRTGREMARVPIDSYLRQGGNHIRVDVRNPAGPSLLHLFLEGLPERIATDETWTAARGGDAPVAAIFADDTRMLGDSFVLPTPWESLQRRATSVLLLFVASAGAFALGSARLGGAAPVWLPRAVLLTVTAGWVWLFVAKMLQLSILFGFDAKAHMEYIDHIVTTGRLPAPDSGWSTYHPPLFYVVSAALQKVRSVFPELSPHILMKIVPALSGLGTVWVTYFLARRVFRDAAGPVALATLVAGTLPMNLYVSAYVSNESPHAFLMSACILATVALLSRPVNGVRTMLLTGILFGLALLTKITVAIVIALAGLFLGFKLMTLERQPVGRALGLLTALAIALLAVSGWYFVGNVVQYGRPVVANWGNFDGIVWWQQPGFHTPAYYASFGEVLWHPYLSACRSFWDGIYSTFWGDGLIGGTTRIAHRPGPWNYDFMSIGYLLALPATLLMIGGCFGAAAAAWRERDASRQLVLLFLLSIIATMGIALVYYPIMLPAYTSAKAFFVLGLTAPLAIATTFGFIAVENALDRLKLPLLRPVFYGWFGTLAAVLYLAFAG